VEIIGLLPELVKQILNNINNLRKALSLLRLNNPLLFFKKNSRACAEVWSVLKCASPRFSALELSFFIAISPLAPKRLEEIRKNEAMSAVPNLLKGMVFLMDSHFLLEEDRHE